MLIFLYNPFGMLLTNRKTINNNSRKWMKTLSRLVKYLILTIFFSLPFQLKIFILAFYPSDVTISVFLLRLFCCFSKHIHKLSFFCCEIFPHSIFYFVKVFTFFNVLAPLSFLQFSWLISSSLFCHYKVFM